jgi:hypothetical protein
MSIIVFGVGNADFTAMNELDADTVPLVFNDVQGQCDIVQFMPSGNFQNLGN